MTKFVFLSSLSIIALLVAILSLYFTSSLSRDFENSLLPLNLDPATTTLRNEIYERLFEIFLAVLAACSAIFAILGVGLYSALRGALEARVANAVRDSVEATQRQTQAWAFKEFGYIWSIIYEPTLQSTLSTVSDDPDDKAKERALEYVNSSLMAAENGVKRLSLIDQRNLPTDRRCEVKKLSADFKNLQIYGESAKFILSGGVSPFEHYDEILKIADELYQESLDKELLDYGFEWHMPHETVAFFKIQIGGRLGKGQDKEDGLKILNNLIEGQRPSRSVPKKSLPSKDWREYIKEEYTRNGIKTD